MTPGDYLLTFDVAKYNRRELPCTFDLQPDV